MPGPVPERSEFRRRRNKTGGSRAAGAVVVEVPAAEAEWHPIARDWYLSLAGSGQSRFYEPSDWQTARYVAEAMSRNLSSGRFSAQLFASVMAASTALLATEGDRRRLRLELERPAVAEADPARVAVLDRYRSGVTAS